MPSWSRVVYGFTPFHSLDARHRDGGKGPGVGFDCVSVIINLYLIFVYRKREW